MSFLKKMTKEFEDLKSNFLKDDDKKEEKKEEKKEKKEDHDRGFLDPQGQPPYGQQSSYGQPPTQPSPSWGPPAVNSLPAGWDKQWDQNSQRWYYIEKATGRTQWDPPVASPGYLPLGHDAPRGDGGYGGGYGGGYNQPTPGPLPGGQFGQQQYPVEEKKKDKGHGGMIAGAAGGLAVGAVGGALVTNALDDDSSDDEHHHRAELVAAPQAGYGQQPEYYAQQPGYNPQPGYAAEPGPPGILPDETRSGSSVSSSDKEDVQEAREEYENASASDKEEAREEYEEEYAETYDD
ncbi:hypothetical protein MMC22_005598 [Lobaria immixta]|nr:hypothetical protein [Lobaria immixta]